MPSRLAVVLFTLAVLLTSRAAHADTRSAYEFLEIRAPARLVWDTLDDFEEFHAWNPTVAATRIVRGNGREIGSIRMLEYRNGARMSQELTHVDPELMRKEWQLVGWTEFPLESYRASISVIETAPDRTMVVWQSRFSTRSIVVPEKEVEVERLFSSLYHMGLERLRTLCESAAGTVQQK